MVLYQTGHTGRPPFFAAAAVLFLMAALAVGSRDWLGAAVSRYGDQYGLSMARTVMKEWIPAAGRQKGRSGPAALEPVLFSYLGSMETETAPAADPAYEKMTARREGADPGKGAQQETGETGRREEAGRPKDADQAGAEGAGQTHEAPARSRETGKPVQRKVRLPVLPRPWPGRRRPFSRAGDPHGKAGRL